LFSYTQVESGCSSRAGWIWVLRGESEHGKQRSLLQVSARDLKDSTVRGLLDFCRESSKGIKVTKSSGGIAFCFSVGAYPRKTTQSEGGEAEDSQGEEDRRLGVVE
jgi:hypothetical protein